MSDENFLTIAIEAAHVAGSYIKRMAGKIIEINFKGTIDLVTEVDLEAEKLITKYIRQFYPQHSFLTEEGSEITGSTDYRWIIDPLDGTTNFAHSFPAYCVSIALEYQRQLIIGVVNDVSRNELFYAEKGDGAHMNNEKIRVSKVNELRLSLLATGFPYDVQTNPDNNLAEFGRFLLEAQAIRRPGSAAIDLCNVACGRFDGFWEPRLNAWDMAAGALILEEAGGKVTDYTGKSLDLFGDQMLASNGLIHDQMVSILSQAADS